MSEHTHSRIHVVIPCAGVGARAGGLLPKQYLPVAGQPMVVHTVNAFRAVKGVDRIVVVLAPTDQGWPMSASASASIGVECVYRGGANRAESVQAGLQHLLYSGAQASDWVMVHDAARCLIEPQDIERLMQTCLSQGKGGLLAVPVADTLKRAQTNAFASGQHVAATLEREGVWQAQTPQMFVMGELAEALAGDLAGITDEASAMERLGHRPVLVEGARSNIKITYPSDFELANAWMASRTQAEYLNETDSRDSSAANAPGDEPIEEYR